MTLNDFLSLIQLAAGLNVAYIAVGISQGYTQVLLDKIFNIRQHINENFESIRATININQESLIHILPSNVNGKDTNSQIEEVKREYEVLARKIVDTEREIENNANLRCEFRCFSGLSLMMFLYCCTLLFIAPFYPNWFLLSLTSIVLIHSLLGWWCENSKLVCRLMFVIYIFIGALICSTLVYILSQKFYWINISNTWENILIIASSLLPMINFVIFFIKIFKKMQTITNDIKVRVKQINDESQGTQSKFELLQKLEELKLKM